MWRWIFYDPILDVNYTVEINPREVQGPKYKKRLTRTPTTAPAAQGRTLIFEGTDEPQSLRWSGVIRTQAFFEAMVEWFEKRHQIQLTDDLGRQFWIYIDEFDPTHLNRVNEPWAHTYSANAVILSWEE